MRSAIIAILLTLTCLGLNAQSHDNTWWLGYISDQMQGGILRHDLIHGDSIRMENKLGRRIKFIGSGAQFSDSTGNLLLSANGCVIYDANEDTIQNGSDLNPSDFSQFCSSEGVYGMNNWGFFLPFPGKESELAVLFHTRVNALDNRLQYTIINLKNSFGKPEVISKNNQMSTDSIGRGAINATKHANGRDWWVASRNALGNQFSIYLLDSSGVRLVRKQAIGLNTTIVRECEMVFSPDGSKLTFSHAIDDLFIYDFDRCEGYLSNPVHIENVDLSDTLQPFSISGMAISADNRFVYRETFKKIAEPDIRRKGVIQYDLFAPNIASSRLDIATFSIATNLHPIDRNYGHMELSPDGRIVVRGPCGGCAGMSIVMHPERAGSECDFRTHYFFDTNQNYGHLPIYPNYRLGPIDGSPCDTLGMNNYPLAGFRYDRLAGLLVDFTSVSWYEPETWHWNFGDPNSGAANTSSEMHPDHVFSAPGLYTVCLTVSNQYGADTLCKQVYIDESVDVNEPQLTETEQGVLVYPNPASAWVEWLFPQEVEGVLRLQAVVSTSSTITIATGNRVRMDVSALPAGVYVWSLQEPDGRLWSGKVVVVRP